MVLLLVSFIAGFLTVLAPCILPVLPAILGVSLAGRGRWSPYVVIGALGVSIFLFTIVLKVSAMCAGVQPETWTRVSGVIIVLFGLFLLFPRLWESLPFLPRVHHFLNRILHRGKSKHSYYGDVLMGFALGPLFSTCSPTYVIIVATVLPVSLPLGILYTFMYMVGLMVALALVVYLGKRIIGKLGTLADPHSWFKRALGALFILFGIVVYSGALTGVGAKLIPERFDIMDIERALLRGTAPVLRDAP